MKSFTRRQFIKTSGIILAGTPFLRHAITEEQTEKKAGNILVLIELKGGNDGLNTLIPYTDKKYYELRPNIAYPEKTVLKLNEDLALAPACQPLLELWNKNELAIIPGVGYPKPNRSHFRSIDIWETASGSEKFLSVGWCNGILQKLKTSYSLPADAIIMGNDDSGPTRGGNLNSLIMITPESFIRQAKRVNSIKTKSQNPALHHIVKVQNNIVETAQIIEKGLQQKAKLKTTFPTSTLGRQLQSVAKLMVADLTVPLFKVSMGGFDTHNNQTGSHPRLLKELSDAIAAFRHEMIQRDLWDRTIMMTYSEFGRRVRENGSRGTDHGTAAPHFIAGGKVKGGIFGNQPSLTKLDKNGDLIFTTDYRRLYSTIIQNWWGLNNNLPGEKFKPLDFI